MGMLLHRHSGVDDKSAPELVIKEKETEKPVEPIFEKKDGYVNDPVRRGRKRNN